MKVYEKEIWFVTGSQHLYGEETLKQVKSNSQKIVRGLDESDLISAKIVFKALLTTADEITRFCREAGSSPGCMGVITWMHTFSPSQMWVRGLAGLSKPLLHFHTQFNRDIPWNEIDMDFMNLNQSAHGGREFGFIMSRMGIDRKVVVGHWQDPLAAEEIDIWIRAAAAWDDAQGMRIARFGDNMRNVAVTEGDKVEALIRMGYQVEGYGTGDLIAHIEKITDKEAETLTDLYLAEYSHAETLLARPNFRWSLFDAARIELGMKAFLEEGGFKAFTTNFENLYGIAQLPGLASQRLMAAGYGFGAEGDWKTAALVRAMKVMDRGLSGGTSFMEDYTYHLDPANTLCLGAHMLEVCPSLAAEKPVLDIQPLSIGGKDDPARLRFTVSAGEAVAASVMDMGNRFRLLVNQVDVVSPAADLPRLPVACAMWKPRPSLKISAQAWILAGGAHHTSFSKALTTEHLGCWADMAGIEMIVIDGETRIPAFKDQLRWNEMYYGMKGLARN